MGVKELKQFREKVLGRTSGGKQVVVTPVSNSRLFRVEFRPGGELPKQLKGRYSDLPSADKAVRSYFESSGKKLITDLEEVNG